MSSRESKTLGITRDSAWPVNRFTSLAMLGVAAGYGFIGHTLRSRGIFDASVPSVPIRAMESMFLWTLGWILLMLARPLTRQFEISRLMRTAMFTPPLIAGAVASVHCLLSASGSASVTTLRTTPYSFIYTISSFLPLICGIASSGTLLYLDRLVVRMDVAGRCKECGYDLRGLVDRRCPECATPFDTAGLSPDDKHRAA